MPRYYIHLIQGSDVLIDPEGIELPDIATLRQRALAIARDLVASDAASGVVNLDTTLRIVDEHDQPVLDLSFADAVAFVSGAGDAPPV